MEIDLDSAEADRVGAFDELLSTLAGALDVRDVFRRLSAVATRIVAHDEADLVLLTDDGRHFRLYASTHEGESRLLGPGEHCALRDPAVPRVFHDGFGSDRGFQSGLRVPVRVDGEPAGVLALLSRHRGRYTERELILAQRVADYVAIAISHQRLAETARREAVDRDRAAHLESSVELLRAISAVLDIRTVFPKVSEIANKVLAHDRLSMSFDDGTGEIVMQAASNADFTHVDRIKLAGDCAHEKGRGFLIIDDLQARSLPIAEPADLQDQIVAAGYRSFLAINAAARDQGLGLEFWSKRPNAFREKDVAVARRIADHVSVAVSHEQLAEASSQVAEARVRAARLGSRVKALVEEPGVRRGHRRVVGQSAAWNDVVKKAAQVASTDTTVLLTGESGTGKEVVARLIHRASARKDGPFVALNCAALPEQLLESELFGYERGAFTGAQQSKPGQIELASGGVLFLDEVSEMSLSAQAKFLRVLQEREFQRLGGTRPLKASIRVLAATNRDLRRAVENGTFREDLFYRLQVFDIRMPPLRERRGDILSLSESFLQEIGQSFGRPPAGLAGYAREMLLRHEWPGNVRELRNALERAAILCEGGLITATHLSLHRERLAPAATTSDLNLVERNTIEQVMRDTGWNKSKAAQRLGLSRTQLYVRLRKYDLERPAYARAERRNR
jgi:transcriptional regulator with GAF, ATPase, and Fis domain